MASQIPLTNKEEVYVKEFCKKELSLLYKNLPKFKKDKIKYEIKYITSPKYKPDLQKNKPREVYFDVRKQEFENLHLERLNDLDILRIKFTHSSAPVSVRYLVPDFTKNKNILSLLDKFPGKILPV